MLKSIDPRLGPDLLHILRTMGHGDEIAIVDGNYPAEAHGRRVVRADGLGAVDVADAVLSVMPLDDFVEQSAFRPGIRDDPDRTEPIFVEFDTVLARHEPDRALHVLHGDAFYQRVRDCYAVVATSERRLYGNLILRKGVVRPA